MGRQGDTELGQIATDLSIRVRSFTRGYTSGLLLSLAFSAVVIFALGVTVERQLLELERVSVAVALGDAMRATFEIAHAGPADGLTAQQARLDAAADVLAVQGDPGYAALATEIRTLAAADTPAAETVLHTRILSLAADPLVTGTAPNGGVWSGAHLLGGFWKAALFGVLCLGLLLVGRLLRDFHTPLTEALVRWKDGFLHADQQAQRAMNFDHMTGLPTRRFLVEHLEHCRATAGQTDEPVAVLYFDFLRFRAINNEFGHEIADRLLLRLSQILNLASGTHDLVARVGGDEFAVSTFGHADHAVEVARDFAALIEAPVDIEGTRVRINCAVGVAIDDGTASASDLLTNASIALAAAKRNPDGGVELYSEELRDRTIDRQTLERELQRAVSNSEIEPFYQPQVDAKTGRVVGFEALARWRHPDRGLLRPVEFIKTAEDCGLIPGISRAMVRKSLMTLTHWLKLGLDVPKVSLNFTAQELRDPDFVDTMLFDVDRVGLKPHNICVELLEAAMIDSAEDPVVQTLARLSAAGFQVELDDFGTGHASLSNLRNIRVNGMKIDRSFVRQMHENEDQQKLTHAMLALAGSLKIASLAEGVETEAEREMLIAMGCERLQGFAIAKPMSAEDATAWLRNYQRSPASDLPAASLRAG